ncbi:MAG: alkaline phosphatase family protein, partial [Candidatus Omnitrophica bacterium]|nr:alkaline phosphatase family protein [Candidatus Omnitrophota bacterium]
MYKFNQTLKKVVILGIDGMDYSITKKLIEEGRLPNLSALMKKGDFLALGTVMPPESVVVWTSLMTGLNPGGHGIFGFILNNFENYNLFLSFSETTISSNKINIRSFNKGVSFWNILTKHNIPCYIYFFPNAFPPEKINGKILSGMGVPDITGVLGKYSFYSVKGRSNFEEEAQGRYVYVQDNKGVIDTSLYGPKIMSGEFIQETKIPIKIFIDEKRKGIKIVLQGKSLFLGCQEWSQWERVSFSLDKFKKARGIVKFYLKSISPYLELYVSPVNINPEEPIFAISYPSSYSKKISQEVGLYYTQGIPHDTWALSRGVLGEEAFLSHVDNILAEKQKILFNEFSKFKRGLFFFYVDTLDTMQHMFWRYTDSQHPLYEDSAKYKNKITEYYEKIDLMIGRLMERLDEQSTLIVLSDHGFGNYRKSVHLNRWLADNGYLFLRNGAKDSDVFSERIDWSKTKAYAIGFGGIYLNRVNREVYGIVTDAQIGKLKDEIKDRLMVFYDMDKQQKVIKNIYKSEDIFQGVYIKDAPDLFVGFNDGYRASWETALGMAPDKILVDNMKKWSGDHLIDASLVPGVIFANKKINLEKPHII